ncbi:hypothetical protein ACN20G_21855 [Streptomyces sp. BI20]|uniref:hypothetical protein n=1 Tax=Streptomyces sp. BI20 TaxID=3403460 RepID=UPI003C77B69F
MPVRDLVVRRAAPALAAFAAVRLTVLATLAVWGRVVGEDAHTRLAARWDSLWYARIAADGYGYQVALPNGDVHADLAFFPLLPWLERGVAAVTGLGYGDAGLVVSAVAGCAAAIGLYALCEHLWGRGTGARAGVLAAALWAALPVGIVQSMAYSEALFTALAVWSLYGALRGHWLWAGLLAAGAGLTRPVGAAVVAGVWLAGLLAWRAGRGSWRTAAGLLLAPAGAAGYVLWVGARTGGGLFGYLDVQGGWGNGFDGGAAFARFLVRLAGSGPAGAVGAVGLALGVALVVAGLVWCARSRLPAPLVLFAGIVVALALCASGYFGSKPRLLLPAFPLVLPPALALARARRGWAVGVPVALTVVAAGYGAFWLMGSGPP